MRSVTTKENPLQSGCSLAELVRRANLYQSSIFLDINSARINAKSLMGVLALSRVEGDTCKILVDGPDESAAMEDLYQYLLRAVSADDSVAE